MDISISAQGISMKFCVTLFIFLKVYFRWHVDNEIYNKYVQLIIKF